MVRHDQLEKIISTEIHRINSYDFRTVCAFCSHFQEYQKHHTFGDFGGIRWESYTVTTIR